MKVTLANGKVVEKVEPVKNSAVIIKTNTQLQEEDANIRRKLTDLPDIKNINIFSQILSYHLFGLSSQDIATVTHIELQNVNNILMSQEFSEYKQKILESIAEKDANNVREFFTKNSMHAAQTVLDIVKCGNPKYALPAAQDILDRAGHRPIDVVEHRNKMDNELRIVYITKNEEKRKQLEEIKPVDAEFEELTNG